MILQAMTLQAMTLQATVSDIAASCSGSCQSSSATGRELPLLVVYSIHNPATSANTSNTRMFASATHGVRHGQVLL